MNITLKEVSKHCGLSTATVSHVIHGTKPVRKETKEKVLRSIEELGYIPHGSARQLKSGSSRLIGVLTVGYNHFFTDILAGIQSQAEELGWKIIVGSTGEDPKAQQSFLDSLMQKRVEGIIMAPITGWAKDKLKRYMNNTPMVFLDRKITGLEEYAVTTDNKHVSKRVIHHLIDKHGYQEIGLIYVDDEGVSSMDERKQGYIEAIQEAGLHVKADVMIDCDGSIPSAQQAMKRMLDEQPQVEAVYITSNNLMQGAYRELKQREIKIPDDLAVIGFDAEPWMEFLQPSISIVEQPVHEMGKKAIQKLIDLKNGKEAKKEELKNNFIIAETCGCKKHNK